MKAQKPRTSKVSVAPPIKVGRVRRPRSDDANAFIPDPQGGPARTDDDLAETLAEGFLQAATQDDDAEDAALDGLVSEEIGGPFVETSGSLEFADGVDESNPSSANREAIPSPTAGLSHGPEVEEEIDEEDAEETRSP
jgi:hypothetical protein